MAVTILLAIFTLALAGIAIEMANTPPTTDKHRRSWRIAYIAVGLGICALTYFQFKIADMQQRQLSDQLKSVQNQLTNSFNENSEQFQQLTEDFSTNSAIAVQTRYTILNNELQKAVAEGDNLQKAHEISDIKPLDIQSVRSQRIQDQEIQANQQKQAQLQQEIDNINNQRLEADREKDFEISKEQLKQKIWNEKKELSAPVIPIFDYAIQKLFKTLTGATDGAGWNIISDFLGQSPTIYASELLTNGVIITGRNFISVGTNPAWLFKIITKTPKFPINYPPDVYPRELYRNNVYATMIVEAKTTNGISRLTITPKFLYRFQDEHNSFGGSSSQSLFRENNIKTDVWFQDIDFSLEVPTGLNWMTNSSYDGYTNDIDTAIIRLIGAQDQQYAVPSKVK